MKNKKQILLITLIMISFFNIELVYSQKNCGGSDTDPWTLIDLKKKSALRYDICKQNTNFATTAFIENRWQDALYYFNLAKVDAESLCEESFEYAEVINKYQYILMMIVTSTYNSKAPCSDVKKTFNYACSKGCLLPSFISEWKDKKLECW